MLHFKVRAQRNSKFYFYQHYHTLCHYIELCSIVISELQSQTEPIVRDLLSPLLPLHRARKGSCDVTTRVQKPFFHHESSIISGLYSLHIS